MNTFLDETRSVRVDAGLACARQLRMSPTVFALLSAEKPATQPWGDFLIEAAIFRIITARNMRGDYRGGHTLSVGIFGGLSGGPDDRQNGGGR